ncbi:UvrB/UvrC motif-containing protein [Staphylococcus ratti]|uniref:UvrB/UvrC motif-containing protein n=1 Tax=Staphylococcus ratti TaxID=2892440 RepID=UPI003B848869
MTHEELKRAQVQQQRNHKPIVLSQEPIHNQSDEHWQAGEDVEGTFVVQQILQHLAAKYGINVDQLVYREEKRCPTCQMSLKDIAHVGKFGCRDCYVTFKEDVYDIVRRVQGGHMTHSGKYPQSSHQKRALKQQIEAKQEKLQALVEAQAFEEAAIVRDEIKALEVQQSEVSQDDRQS